MPATLLAVWAVTQAAAPGAAPTVPPPSGSPTAAAGELARYAMEHPKEFAIEYEKTLTAEQREMRRAAEFAITHAKEHEAMVESRMNEEQRREKALAKFSMADPKLFQDLIMPLMAISNQVDRLRAIDGAIPAQFKIVPATPQP